MGPSWLWSSGQAAGGESSSRLPASVCWWGRAPVSFFDPLMLPYKINFCFQKYLLSCCFHLYRENYRKKDSRIYLWRQWAQASPSVLPLTPMGASYGPLPPILFRGVGHSFPRTVPRCLFYLLKCCPFFKILPEMPLPPPKPSITLFWPLNKHFCVIKLLHVG